MAKKKSKPQKIAFNPITYLRSESARKLPVYECLLPKGWEEIKKFPVIFARKHVNGNITFVSVLVDLLCTGAKDVIFFVNEPESLYREILRRYEDELLLEFLPVSYELIHNVIFESVAFAEDYGIAPHEDFRFAELVLEEDSDDFPRIEIPLGENGKAHLYLNIEDERAPYFERQILKYGDPKTYEITRNDFNPFLDGVDWDEEEEFEDEDDLDTCFGWGEAEWEDFYDAGEFEDLDSDLVYFTIQRIPGYSYDKMVDEPLFSPFLEIEWTSDPISRKAFSKQELVFLEQVFEKLEDADLELDGPDPELLEFIEGGISKYPKNNILLQYKWEYHQRSADMEAALKIALEMKEKFPEYLFGLTCHAQTLIENGEVDSIPEAMNDFTRIQDFLPKRGKFHLSELQVFYSPWIYYYAKTGQVRAAHFLITLLEDHLISNAYPLHELVESAYFEAASQVVKLYYQKVKSGQVSKDEFMEMALSDW